MLIGAAVAALVLANGPLADAFHHLLEARFGPVMQDDGECDDLFAGDEPD